MGEKAGDETLAGRVEAVRAFNRFWTARIGVLDANHLGTSFSLAEARLLFELSRRRKTDASGAHVSELRRKLGLDAGYLSRILGQFREKALVATESSSDDARRQVVRLTARGRAAARSLEQRAVSHVGDILSPLEDAEQRQLVGALTTVQRVLDRVEPVREMVVRSPRPGDFGWVVERHGALYAKEYGWDERFEGLVASIVAQHLGDKERAAAWIAEVAGERAGCVFCTKKDTHTAQLRLLLVDPRFRGRGIGARLIDECVSFAKGAGYSTLVLWTNDVLVDARRLYERAGFRLVSSKKHASFGPELTGQTWELSLG